MNSLQRWFSKRSRNLERVLISVTLVVLFLLFAAQMLMTSEQARYYLNRVEYLEGTPYRWPEEDHTGGRSGLFLRGIYLDGFLPRQSSILAETILRSWRERV